MHYRYPFLLGALLLGTLSANAQRARINVGPSRWVENPTYQGRTPQTPSHSYTSVDAYGNVTRTTVQTPLAGATSVPGLIANQAILGANTTSSTSFRTGNVYGNGRGALSSNYCPPGYYPPAYYPPVYPPAYPYPYPAANNYYYPPTPYTVPIQQGNYDWQHPATVTVIPPRGGYYGGYPAPAYPYPYPYPSPYSYPGYPYPYSGTTTIITGSNQGSISTRSSSSGYGLSVGNGGVSAQVSNRNSSSSTVVTTR